MGFYLLSPQLGTLTRVGCIDLAGFVIAGSRWARLAGSGRLSPRFVLCFLLPGETELGSAEEQPNTTMLRTVPEPGQGGRMNPRAWGSFAPGLFRIRRSFFCLVMP